MHLNNPARRICDLMVVKPAVLANKYAGETAVNDDVFAGEDEGCLATIDAAGARIDLEGPHPQPFSCAQEKGVVLCVFCKQANNKHPTKQLPSPSQWRGAGGEVTCEPDSIDR